MLSLPGSYVDTDTSVTQNNTRHTAGVVLHRCVC